MQRIGRMDRRTFVQLSTGAMIAAASPGLMGDVAEPAITSAVGLFKATGRHYSWEYVQGEDRFRLLDAKGRLMVTSVMQPAVVVAPCGGARLEELCGGKGCRGEGGWEPRGDCVRRGERRGAGPGELAVRCAWDLARAGGV